MSKTYCQHSTHMRSNLSPLKNTSLLKVAQVVFLRNNYVSSSKAIYKYDNQKKNERF